MENKNDTLQKQETKDTAEDKTFTQEEVDSIVEARLSRQRNKYENMMKGMTPESADIAERESDLQKREMQFLAKTVLSEKGLSFDLMPLLNLENEEKLTESIELLANSIKSSANSEVEKRLRGGKPPQEAKSNNNIDKGERELSKAFGLL